MKEKIHRMKILFVTSNGIEDSAFGGAKASRRNYELLREYGEVEVFTIRKRSNIASMLSAIQGYFPPSGKRDLLQIGAMLEAEKSGTEVPNFEISARQRRAERCKYDIVFFDGSHFGNMVKYVRDKGCKIICFFHNCEYDYIEVRFGKQNSLKKSIYKHIIKKQERLAAQGADCNIAFTRRDAERIHELYGVQMPQILPLSLIDVYEKRTPKKGKEKECLLFGPLGQANEEAFGWFVERVSPYLHCKTRIAGQGFEVHQKDWETSMVKVQGYVKDIAQLYADAACVAIPLLSGGGMKIKTAEALMFGKYVFGTEEAFVGYELAYEKTGGKCNSAQEFIDKINTFLDDRGEGFYNTDSRQCYEEKYSLEASRAIFGSLLSGLV